EEVRLTLDTENSEISDVNFIIDKEDMVLSAKPITISVKQPVIFYLNEADELHIITEFNMTKNTRIEIVNYMGQVVMQQDVTINNGFDEIILSLSSLNNNFYIVNMIVEGEQSFSSKFIK
ncbi:MAG: T9SS type A sorting domain-containing protein, partial [Bacteroidales bacterium]|nr:T9SS type A sorting domain-containing protein [Bacteroidales bacterium]